MHVQEAGEILRESLIPPPCEKDLICVQARYEVGSEESNVKRVFSYSMREEIAARILG